MHCGHYFRTSRKIGVASPFTTGARHASAVRGEFAAGPRRGPCFSSPLGSHGPCPKGCPSARITCRNFRSTEAYSAPLKATAERGTHSSNCFTQVLWREPDMSREAMYRHKSPAVRQRPWGTPWIGALSWHLADANWSSILLPETPGAPDLYPARLHVERSGENGSGWRRSFSNLHPAKLRARGTFLGSVGLSLVTKSYHDGNVA